MNKPLRRTAVIIGASSGIGEALAHELNRADWHLGLLARRLDRLETLRETLAQETVVRAFDVTQPDAAAILEHVLDELGGVDLVIISAGTGHNAALDWELDLDTVTVNVLGFMAVAQAAMRYFLRRGSGHLVGISSVAARRGNRASAYAASKAFQSVYLGGLRDVARHSGRLVVASPVKAARQILRAVQKRKKHAYITRRYALVAFILKLLPRPG
ncbi:MAG: SDR family NAD(P)-dependent oxidoreductase [Vicinamibacterales bacterium]